MNIYGFQKSTLLDYPEHLACTIFTGTCNFCCPFCHNGGLVLHTASLPLIPEEEIFSYLKKRQSILEGVCITGGEPTLQKDLKQFIIQIKQLGYQVKLDTNGYRPQILQELLQEHLLDYVAMDIKNSPQSYAKTCGISTIELEHINTSIALLKNSQINYEFRTTVVEELHSADDMLAISEWLKGDSRYYIQCYQDSPDLIMKGYHAHSVQTLQHFLTLMLPNLPNAKLRGVDEE